MAVLHVFLKNTYILWHKSCFYSIIQTVILFHIVMNTDILKKVEEGQYKKRPDVKVGDTVKLHLKITEGEKERTQIFEGVVIAMKGAGLGSTITVRKISYGVGVEKIVPLHSPMLEKIEIVKRGTVRRSKLYYLRDRVGKRALKVQNVKDVYMTDEEDIVVPETGEAEELEEEKAIEEEPAEVDGKTEESTGEKN